MNPADIPIVPATWHDIGALRKHEKECFNKDDAWPLIDLISTLILPEIVRLKLEADGRMIGFFAGSTHQRAGFGSVLSLSISPDWQGLGLGKRLLEAGETALNTQHFELCTRRSNLPAIHLYQKAGYVQTDVWKGYYFGEDALVFEKQIIC
ncbi:MAG: N-acetyltransferase [Anaerolineaceae bacterium]|jgi:ribosomal-protein-alanine N-acetyltransferase